MFKRIVVALDGSPLAEEALTHAAALAVTLNSELHLVSVAEGKPDLTDHIIGYEWIGHSARVKDEVSHLTNYLTKIRGTLPPTLSLIHTTVVTGEAANSIIAYTADNNCDVIVLCSHGRSGVLRWALGSVADRIMRVSTVPVLLIRAGSNA